jgi:hypothetical protein
MPVLRVFPTHRGVFRLDGDALLAFEIHGIHGPFLDLLVLAEGAALLQQAIHESCFAMIDVGDDGDIADVFSVHVRGVKNKIAPAAGCGGAVSCSRR